MQKNNVSFVIEVEPTDTIYDVKELIYKYKNIPVNKQTLIFCGKLLDDDMVISNHFQSDDSITLVI